MKIVVIELLKNTPINTGGKAASFYIVNTLAEKYNIDYYYFEEDLESGYNPNKKFHGHKIKNKLEKIFGFLPKKMRKLHFEYLIYKKDIKKIKADLIILQFPYLYHIAKLISKYNNNAPIILIEHNIEWIYQKNNKNIFWPMVNILEKKVLKKTNKVLCISNKDYEYIKKFRKDAEFIEIGAVKEIFKPDGKKAKYNAGFNILFYGKLDAEQNIWAINTIIDKIRPKLDKNININIFGSGDIKRELPEDINFYGQVDNPAEYIRATDAVIVPLKDSSGIKMRILESLYCGKIVIATKEATEGLSTELRKNIIVCNNENDIILWINKLRKNKKLKKDLEKKVIKNIRDYDKRIKKELIDKIIKNA